MPQMPQEIGGIIISDETKKTKTSGTRPLAGYSKGGARKKTCSEFGLCWTTVLALGRVATVGTSERWIVSRYLVHRIASRRWQTK
jgi:hypothetical protein